MSSRAETGIPRRGDKVWSRHRFNQGLQPNGVVTRIDWEWRSVVITYWDDTSDELDLRDFRDSSMMVFDRHHQGTWNIGGKHPLIRESNRESETSDENPGETNERIEWKD